MATDKTPTHKRIKRAETGRDDWKVKALARRAENVKLKNDVTSIEKSLVDAIARNHELAELLKTANKKIAEQDKLMEKLKKKL